MSAESYADLVAKYFAVRDGFARQQQEHEAEMDRVIWAIGDIVCEGESLTQLDVLRKTLGILNRIAHATDSLDPIDEE